MNAKYLLTGFFLISILPGFISCKKYLDAKPDSNLSTPSTLDDLQSLIDNSNILNDAITLTNEGADEFYLTDADWAATGNPNQAGYVWDPATEAKDDWSVQYKSVLYANTVLENLLKITSQGQEEKWKNIKGAALFFRANHFYQLAQQFAPPYDHNSASTALGIPLRLSSDFNKPSARSTVEQTYNQVINDLLEAAPLLPVRPLHKTRPGRATAFALLARVYLQMGEYTKAREYASTSLEGYSTLIDYNELDAGAVDPLPIFNDEVLFYASNISSIIPYYGKVDSVLYRSFDANDLRKTIFFQDNGDGSFSFKTSYNGSIYDMFQGIATDELYLTRAECYARAGNTNAALQDLNTLLIKRWKAGTFAPFTAASPKEALSLILQERKKELVLRGTRWSDLRRLNPDPEWAVTLKRVINGKEYTLPPNDLRYTLLIPREVINLTGIPQNKR